MKLDLRRRLRMAARHVGWWWSDVRLLFRRTFQEYVDDNCPDVAAGISYYVLFSIFPLVILAVSVTGMILSDEDLRADVTRRLLGALPILPGKGQQELSRILEGVAHGSAISGAASLLGLVWSASAVMGALRYALNHAWDSPVRRPFVRGKLVDALMIVLVGGLLGLSMGGTLFLQVARRVSDRISDALGPFGAGARLGFEIIVVVVPLSVSFLTFLLIYKVVPNVKTRSRELWPGALFAAVLFEIAKTAFAFYLRFFGHYDRVYGSLGAVVAFLFFVYIGANVLLLGAEMASEWARIVHGVYDDAPRRPSGGDTTLRGRVLSTLSGLVRHSGPPVSEELDPEARTARQRRRISQASDDDGRPGGGGEPG